MDAPNHHADIGQYFDFGGAALPDASHGISQNDDMSSGEQPKRGLCPAHGDDAHDGCLCHGFQDDFGIFEVPQAEKNDTDMNQDFSNWIPRYHKPEHACDYCRSRGLECFIYDGALGGVRCSPCNALFRPCSFEHPGGAQLKSKTTLDTLALVTEDSASHFGGLTGEKPMRCLGHVGPIETLDGDKGLRKGAAAARFPRQAVMILKDWMEEHIGHPYPTEEDKEQLKQKTGLTISQITNWMANTRRRQKTRQKRSASPSLRPSTEPIDIPPGRTWESLNPFERWKHSPPENEPAPFTAIAEAVENFDPPEPPSLSSSFGGRKGNSNGSASGSFSVFRAPSTTSLETGLTNISSGSHGSAQWSHGSRNSFGSMNSNSKKDRRRRRRVPPRTPKIDSESSTSRVFQCTFCTDRFKSKYDWSRHEKTLHLSLEKWICAPLGEVITCSASGQRKCVYCDALDPSKEHLDTHNHRTCEDKGLESRTFYRKDHLRQHLRLMHNCKMTPAMDNWKAEVTYIKSRCGFCGMDFDKWQDRVDHLAKEFRNGAQMKNWKGCRGLDPNVAALVTNAMPPYLIANESKSPFPFSASNVPSMAQLSVPADLEVLIPNTNTSLDSLLSGGPLQPTSFSQEGSDISLAFNNSTSPSTANFTPQFSLSSSSPQPSNTRATCWEILTVRLGQFARRYIEEHGHGTITDESIQREARRILYDDPDDTWNQTAADNPEWLNLFKQVHGLTTVPANFKLHEAYEDLGLNADANGEFSAINEFMRSDWSNACSVHIPDLTSDLHGNQLGNLPSGEPNCFTSPTWDQVPAGFEIPGHESSISNNATTQLSQPPPFQGTIGGAQVMRWDEQDLEMALDFHS